MWGVGYGKDVGRDVGGWLRGCGWLVLATLSWVRRSMRGVDSAEAGGAVSMVAGAVAVRASGICTGIVMREGGRADGALWAGGAGRYAA